MRLDYVGFAKLRPGRIHIYCPGCGRKQSNCHRTEGPGNVADPPTAVLAHIYCDKHDTGCGGDFTRFLDAEGRFLCGYCGRHDCQDGGRGERECDEALVNAAVTSRLAGVGMVEHAEA